MEQKRLEQLKQQINKTLEAAIKKTLTGQHLINLNLYNNRIEKTSFQFLIQRMLQQKYKVRSLNLSQNPNLNFDGCESLRNQVFDELKDLDLNLNDIKDYGGKVLSEIKLNNLKTLNIGSNGVSVEGITFLSKSQWFYNLRLLGLNNNPLEDDGLEFFKGVFHNLEELFLINTKITAKGIGYLATAEFPKLKTLSLGKNKISDEGCQELVKLKLPKLQLLHLNENGIQAAGIAILKKGQWPNLTLVYLANNKIGDEGCKHIIQAKWKKLNWLCLSQCEIGDAGLRWISKASWPQLKTLRLSKNYFQLRGFKPFSKAYFPKLQVLLFDLDRCPSQINKELIKMELPALKKLKIYETNRYYYYQYRNSTPKYVENKQLWSELFGKAYPQVQL